MWNVLVGWVEFFGEVILELVCEGGNQLSYFFGCFVGRRVDVYEHPASIGELWLVGFFIEGAGVSEEETPAIVGIERDDEIFTVCRWEFGVALHRVLKVIGEEVFFQKSLLIVAL